MEVFFESFGEKKLKSYPSVQQNSFSLTKDRQGEERPKNPSSELQKKKVENNKTAMGRIRLRGDLINVYKYLQGGGQEDGARLFPVVPSDRTRGNGHKLEPRKLQLNPRKNFFPLRVPEPWNRLPGEAVESPSLEIFQPPWLRCCAACSG